MIASAAAPANRGGAGVAAMVSAAVSLTAHAATTTAHKLAATQMNRDFMTDLLCLVVSDHDGIEVDCRTFANGHRATGGPDLLTTRTHRRACEIFRFTTAIRR